MGVDGFNLLIQDFCAYCPDFEPEVEQIDGSSFSEPMKYINNIRCENRKKCARIAENIGRKIK